MITVTDTLLIDFKREAAGTKRLLERVPEDKFTWKPHEKSTALGRLSMHVSELPWWIDDIITKGEYNFADHPFKPNIPTTLAQVFAEFEAKYNRTVELLSSTNDEELQKPWRLKLGDKVISEMPKWEAIRQVLDHIIHHRGQLTVFLRLNNVPLPGLFGPTADER